MQPDVFILAGKMQRCSRFGAWWWNLHMTIWLRALNEMVRRHRRARRCLSSHGCLKMLANNCQRQTIARRYCVRVIDYIRARSALVREARTVTDYKLAAGAQMSCLRKHQSIAGYTEIECGGADGR